LRNFVGLSHVTSSLQRLWQILPGELFFANPSDGTGDAVLITRKPHSKKPSVRSSGEVNRGLVKGIQNIMQTIATNPVIMGFLPPPEVALLLPPTSKLNVPSPVKSSDWSPSPDDWDDTPPLRCTALDDF
jgi:hypothetical protein